MWGTVGLKFWYNLKKRYDTVFDCKKGQKFELDRSHWCTYSNFCQMYDEVAKEMVDAGIAVEFPVPVWMDRYGNIVEEDFAYGCKVTHDVKRPANCFALDELGGNTSQKGDGQNAGQLFVCGKGEVPQITINVRSKHYTVMGITAFTGEIVMCVIIFAGLKPNALYETGFDPFAARTGDWEDKDFLEKNTGQGKMFPCGPTCTFKGRDIPCFCRWSANGSVTSKILKEILETLDFYGVADREGGTLPFLLLDGHGSRFELPFLDYITEKPHEWCVVIGVPYGTSLWQIGDSEEQNGAMNVASAKKKQNIVDTNMTHSMSPYIYPHDIIRIVNFGWAQSFGNTETNRQAISARGWFPYNRRLMMEPGLRATMTKAETQKERDGTSNIHLPSYFTHEVVDLADKPIYNPKFASKKHDKDKQECNFSDGTAAWALDIIVKKSDQMAARERLRKNFEEGVLISENLKKAKKVTAGVLVSSRKHRIGMDVRNEITYRKRQRIEKEATDKQKEEQALNLLVEKARQVWAVQTDVTKMTNKQLLTILRPLRQKDDPPIPSRKDQLLNRYAEWSHRITPDMITPPLSATTPPPPGTTAASPPSATAPPPSATALSLSVAARPLSATACPPSATTPPPSATAPPPLSATTPPSTAYNDTNSIFDDADEEDENNDDEMHEFWKQDNMILFST